MFWNKPKCTHSDVYETLVQRVRNVELRMDDMEAFQDNIRNMARKVQDRKRKEENDAAEPEDLKSRMLIPE